MALTSISSLPSTAQSTEFEQRPGASEREGAAVAAAAAFARAGNIRAAEDALAQTNRAVRGSSVWHLEAGRLALAAADQSKGAGTSSSSSELAHSALRSAQTALNEATVASEKVSALGLAAIIQERFLGDHEAAIQCYKSILQINPKLRGAMAALKRLDPKSSNNNAANQR